MGFGPREVDAMTLWEFAACLDGYAEAHGARRPRGDIEEARLAEMGIAGF